MARAFPSAPEPDQSPAPESSANWHKGPPGRAVVAAWVPVLNQPGRLRSTRLRSSRPPQCQGGWANHDRVRALEQPVDVATARWPRWRTEKRRGAFIHHQAPRDCVSGDPGHIRQQLPFSGRKLRPPSRSSVARPSGAGAASASRPRSRTKRQPLAGRRWRHSRRRLVATLPLNRNVPAEPHQAASRRVGNRQLADCRLP